MSSKCREAAEWMAARRAGLDEGTSLRLETHLQTCDQCRADITAEDRIHELLQELPSPRLSTRRRAIEAALRDAGRTAAPRPARRTWAYVGLAVAAGAILGFVGLSQGGDSGRALAKLSPEGVLDFGGVKIVASDDADLEWVAASRSVVLQHGELRAEVDPSDGRRFQVRTPSLLVEVTGTLFSVGVDWVRVERGSVRVSSLTGEVLRESLGAGEVFRYEVARALPPTRPEEVPGDAAETVTAVSQVTASVLRSPEDVSTQARPRPPETDAPNVSTLLGNARAAIGRGDPSAAQRILGEMRGQAHSQYQAAEADTITAEIALLRGNRSLAIQRYVSLSRRYSHLPAGQNALFSAARLSVSSGADERAQDLFQEYVRRYPTGRFRAEADRRLSRIAERQQQ